MIKPEDLRIGNYVLLEDKGVYQIDSGHDIDEIGSFPPESTYCKGIQLNEQWLIDLGFELDDQDCYSQWCGALNYSVSLKYGFCFGQGMDYSNEIDLKHVHQLQNLYHALTGKELIKKTLN